MLHHFPYYLAIVLLIILLIMLANKIKVAYPILLVIAGMLLSFVPGVPPIVIDPELIFIIFLPPLLYEAAWSISWKELWKWRRIVFSFAFIIVFITALTVALVSNYFIPGFTLPLGFLLGGIIAPPDAVSAGAILKFVKIPTRMATILEGESLLNDASSLIIFRFALLAVGTGQFVLNTAALDFVWMIVGGLGIGLLVAYMFYKAHTFLPTDVNMDIALTIVAPYLMYILAEEVHSSGVLAVVGGGLYLANRSHEFLSGSSRLRAYNVWGAFCFILNGLVFMLIGLDLPQITSNLNGASLSEAIGYGVLITGTLMATRILSAYGAAGFTMIAKNFIPVADTKSPGIKEPLLIGWAGMRGVVSLAAALSIPLQMGDGSAFPQRNLILFITFVVILLTLLLQGLTLPWLIKKLNFQDTDYPISEEESYHQIHKKLAGKSLVMLRTTYSQDLKSQPALQQLERKWEEQGFLMDDSNVGAQCRLVYLEILKQQRKWLLEWNKDMSINDEVIRKHMSRLDLEEEKLRYL